MSDFEDFEKKAAQQREKNSKLIEEFEEYLKEKGLSGKTVEKHGSNIAFFVDVFLIYEDVLTPAEGIEEIGIFLSSWFPRKALWASPAHVKDYCAGFKKFYKFLLEKGVIEEEEYRDMLEKIKEDKDDWLQANTFF